MSKLFLKLPPAAKADDVKQARMPKVIHKMISNSVAGFLQ